MGAIPNYYKTLGVAAYSEDVVIQAAYRALMRRYHPDTNKAADAQKRATEINQAYLVLSDPKKRAEYDATLKRARTSADQESSRQKTSSGSSPPPPPPPPPHRSGAGSNAREVESHLPRGRTAVWALVVGAIILIILLPAIFSQSANRNSQINMMNVDEDVATTDMNATDLNAVSEVPTTLADIPASEPEFADIEQSTTRFARILVGNGMAGARSFSEKCHDKVRMQPSWSAADRCAAFDYAAAYVDDQVAGNAGWPRIPYFQFQRDNQDDRYEAAGAPGYTLATRLQKIRTAAEEAASFAVRSELAKHGESNRSEQQPANAENAPALTNPSAGNNPSFDCGKASISTEVTICANSGLSTLDRNMASQYFRALSAGTSDQRVQLRRTADRFLAYRNACSTVSCISNAYAGRMREIRDILEGRWKPPANQ